MCSIPCLCAWIYVGCYAMCYFRPLFLNISLSCFSALLVGCRSRSCGLGHIRTPRPILKGLDRFVLHVNVFLIASMLYLHVSLSRSRLCHALCPSWACARVVTSIPPKICLDVGVLVLHLLHFVRCWYACLACFAPLIWLSLLLCIFARLPTCSCISLCVVHILIQWNYGHSIQTYICPPRSLSFFW